MILYEISAEALTDLLEIWAHIAADSVDLADRLDAEFHSLFESLGRMPGQGHTRTDLTGMPVCFFPLYSVFGHLPERHQADPHHRRPARPTRPETHTTEAYLKPTQK